MKFFLTHHFHGYGNRKGGSRYACNYCPFRTDDGFKAAQAHWEQHHSGHVETPVRTSDTVPDLSLAEMKKALNLLAHRIVELEEELKSYQGIEANLAALEARNRKLNEILAQSHKVELSADFRRVYDDLVKR
jgi:hypothetical protein